LQRCRVIPFVVEHADCTVRAVPPASEISRRRRIAESLIGGWVPRAIKISNALAISPICR
jgi:hypothetical protein